MSDQGLPPPPYGKAPGFGYGQAPPPGYGHPAAPPPNNYLVWAILTTVACCTPLGIASIVFSAQVNGMWAAGDIAGARASAEKAKKFATWSAISMGVVYLILIALAVVAAVAGSDSTTY